MIVRQLGEIDGTANSRSIALSPNVAWMRPDIARGDCPPLPAPDTSDASHAPDTMSSRHVEAAPIRSRIPDEWSGRNY